MARSFIALIFAILLTIGGSSFAADITIIHTNDLHSHLLGFPPNIDYTPGTTGDDATVGGWARIATIIKNVKKNSRNPVLVFDAGDAHMGTLFHTICREHALELRLLSELGYDAMALGNHEFDLTPDGLARILNSARRNGKMPAVLLSNAIFSAESPRDDSLEKAFRDGLAQKYSVITRGGLRIGLFALMGIDAAEVAPFASPVKFDDMIESAKKMVSFLREEKKAQLVICLSHSGLTRRGGRPSEDENLAKKVGGIDIIVSGHTHTLQATPLVVNGTVIVQGWDYGKRVGVLDLSFDGKKARVKDYKYITVDDSVPGDRAIQAIIDTHIGIIDREVLSPYGLKFYQTIAHTKFDIPFEEQAREYPLGNLIADSLRWYANRHAYDKNAPSTRVVAAVESTGIIRDALFRGKTGKLAVCDIFKTFPLGIGFAGDDTMGYPIVTMYITANEIKKALEVLTSIAPIKGNSYYLQLSGIKFTYNPRRMIFDRVTGIWLGDEESGYEKLDYSAGNLKQYRIAANIYNATFLKIIGRFTSNILTIVPRDREGNPIQDLTTAIIDRDPKVKGVQGLKEWAGLIEYMKTFPDIDRDGIPDVPEKYRAALGRIVMEPSWSPVALLRGGSWITWTAFGILLLLLAGVTALVVLIRKKLRK
jgi:5'-nucleotidase